MKRVFMIVLGLLAIMTASLNAKAQDISVTLIPGWTWIGFPKTEAMDIADALGDFAPEEGDVIKSKYGMARYHNGVWRGNLQRLTPGLGYMYYNNRAEPVNLVFVLTAPQSHVTVTTSEPMLITAISAMGGGEVTTTDGTYILVKGLCWATHENPTTNDDFYQEAESGVGSFSVSMTDLNIGTTYYVRAYAVTSNGTVYGDQKTFTTRDGIPTLTTAEVTDITGATAICGGNITDNGGLNVTARGVCWSTSPNPTVADPHITNGSGNGSYTSSITGLGVSTTYYVRAYATTAAGTGYGEQKTFTTRDGVPEVVTSSVTDIYSNFATCGGTVIDDGGLEIVSRGICWSTISNPTISDGHTVNGSGLGSFSGNMLGLNYNTIYYVRAYATTSQATAYGNEMVFTSLAQIWANGVLPGVFSVSPDHQVRFSQGNLQYKASTNSWRFALNQWDWVGGHCWIGSNYLCCEEGCDESYYDTIGNVYENGIKSNNNEISSSYSGWIDLFGWGTSGWHDSNDPYNVRYQPWSNATSTVNTSYNNYGYGPSTNMPFSNLTGNSSNYDWGVYNSISNGGNQPNQWRALTKDEWEYVFNTRTTASGISWVIGYVNGVIGVILLPDNWDSSIYELYLDHEICYFPDCHGWNYISATDWVNILEPNGAVFFPLTGYRSGSTYHYQESRDECWNDDCSFYWSTSNRSTKYAYCVRFTRAEGFENEWFTVECSPYRSRFRGSSVRLVCPVE